ncbi:MAG: transcriptional repressor [Clostridia bacterium]|nr:transcriptional repressor [Clostridia bacterium]
MRRIISDIEQRLKARDYKLTSQREQILKVLLRHQNRHLTAEEVYKLVKKDIPEIGLATIYRTLELFLDMEIIHSITMEGGCRRYEFLGQDKQQHHHHHLICTQCGKIISVSEDLLENLEICLAEKYGFIVENHQLKLFGICRECAGQKNDPEV